MKIIYKIKKYYPEKNIISVSFCNLKSREPIDNYQSLAVDCTHLDMFDVDSFSESSIDMLVQAFTVTNDWGAYLKIKEQLAVKIIEIVEKNNAGFAFPSQSLYVESFPKDHPEIFNPISKK